MKPLACGRAIPLGMPDARVEQHKDRCAKAHPPLACRRILGSQLHQAAKKQGEMRRW